MNNSFRLILSAILGFGWLFGGISQANPDPLTLGYEQIQELNKSVSDLNYKNDFISLIDIAEQKYDDAVDAKDAKDNAYDSYDDAVVAEATALEEKNLAQSAVDGQTVTVATALTNKNNAKDALDISEVNLSTANTNLQTTQSAVQNAGNSGLYYTVYYLTRGFNGVAIPDAVICTGVWYPTSMQPPVCGNRYENFVVKFTGQITVPSHWTSTYFAGYTDDGFKMYVDGQLAINAWVEKGSSWSSYSPVYDVSQDKTLDV